MFTVSKIINALIKNNISISVAESCTGGLISHTLAKHIGVSKIFKCGIIAYSNKAKINYLSVSKKTLANHGAVSSNVALEMIENLYVKEKTDICVSTTGIAGPGGGSKYKPVGLVYVGIKYRKKNFIYEKNFVGDRKDIQRKTKDFIFYKINQLI